MITTYTETKVPSTDGIHTLCGRVYLPATQPKGYLHVVHGMTEHIARYDAFMQAVADAGYIVFGFDNLGHGHTALDGSELGYIADRDGWLTLARDVIAFADAVKAEYGDLPYYLLGHSMGSFIVRTVATKVRRPDKLIVMGTGGPNPAGGIGLALIRLIKAARGDKYISDFIYQMAFGSYNKRFDGDDPYSWLTKDKAIREAYGQDPFCTFRFTVSAMGDLLHLNQYTNSAAWFKAVDPTLPMLLVSGQEDPVGNYAKGVKAVYGKLKKREANVKLYLYPNCRHEILNDSCKGQVTKDILAFLEK